MSPNEKLNNYSLSGELPQKVGLAKSGSVILLRKARVQDVREILELINRFAEQNLMLPRGPQYLYENIRDFIVAINEEAGSSGGGESNPIQSGNPSERLVGCGSLHGLGADIAEVRSMVIHPDYQHRGLGEKIVECMREEARHLGINILFTLTLAEKFFSRCGFERKARDEFPRKVWGECVYCPKYFKCDEIGMILEI
ncbi:MAG: N-acetyltransferase [Candidatus Auribacterota bacterium]|nr:N-acetyltransferase [Candidatus Auribacterota bacterium]